MREKKEKKRKIRCQLQLEVVQQHSWLLESAVIGSRGKGKCWKVWLVASSLRFNEG